jgi:putative two-component system response regulator
MSVSALLREARLMFVDDEPANLKLLERMLGSEGYANIVRVQDPRQVLAHYREQRPDLVLLDLHMPHLDGYQVMAQLQALGDPLLPPIVILTAEFGRASLLKALEAGARDYLGKPLDRAELVMRVRNILEAQLAHRMAHDQQLALAAMVRARTEQLNQGRMQAVRCLGRAAEYRDNETGLHVVRMSECSALLARGMGWSEADCELMLHASTMHDVGKIGIPDAILLKPGALTPAEWSVMKRHADIGGHILAEGDSELLQLARLIATSHHEKWDGSGYPAGLAGAAIPQAGRIVAVADVFDALTSVRPYKPAWPVAAAVAHIAAQSGSHFDPQVVAQFLRLQAEILAIRERHLEPECCAG